MSRVAGKRIALNKHEVAEFFEQRAQKFNAQTPLTAILYQDKHPGARRETRRIGA